MKRAGVSFFALLCYLGPTAALPSSAERTDQLLLECQGKQPTEMPEAGLLSCSRYIDGILIVPGVNVNIMVLPGRWRT